jgi:hypothetical protein
MYKFTICETDAENDHMLAHGDIENGRILESEQTQSDDLLIGIDRQATFASIIQFVTINQFCSTKKRN